jgi:hypothetical protein
LPHPDSPAGRYLTPQEIRTPALAERVQAVVAAYLRALRLAPAAVYRETGCQLDQVIDGLLPGLLQMLAALGISAMAGASAGAAVGFFLGGVGAAPGAIVGGELGLEVGTALLAWMGLGFLAVAIGQGMGELTGVLRRAIRCAWHAPEQHFLSFETDRAAEDLARAVGILFRLILQGLLAYVLKNGAVSASQAAASTGQAIISGGARAASGATLAEVSALLRKSKLPDGFVVWLERNWDDLKRNPKLTSNKTAPSISSQSSSAVTPSEMKAMRERQGSDGVAGKSGNESNAIPEKITDKKAALDEQAAGDNIDLNKKRAAFCGSTGKNCPNVPDNIRIRGAAEAPRLVPYNSNASGVIRTQQEAIDLARSYGAEIGDDITIGFMKNWTRTDADAEYFYRLRDYKPDDWVEWDDFLHETTGKIPVRFNANILNSDESIVAHIAHEMHELNALRNIFAERGAMQARELNKLIATRRQGGLAGNLHEQAWDIADQLVFKMRGGQ